MTKKFRIRSFGVVACSLLLGLAAIGCGIIGGSTTVKIGLLSPQPGTIAE